MEVENVFKIAVTDGRVRDVTNGDSEVVDLQVPELPSRPVESALKDAPNGTVELASSHV